MTRVDGKVLLHPMCTLPLSISICVCVPGGCRLFEKKRECVVAPVAVHCVCGWYIVDDELFAAGVCVRTMCIRLSVLGTSLSVL